MSIRCVETINVRPPRCNIGHEISLLKEQCVSDLGLAVPIIRCHSFKWTRVSRKMEFCAWISDLCIPFWLLELTWTLKLTTHIRLLACCLTRRVWGLILALTPELGSRASVAKCSWGSDFGMRGGGLTLESELRVWVMNPESAESTCKKDVVWGLGV